MRTLRFFFRKNCHLAALFLLLCIQTACEDNKFEPIDSTSASVAEMGKNKELLYNEIKAQMGVNGNTKKLGFLLQALPYSEDSIKMVLQQTSAETKVVIIPTVYNLYVSTTGDDNNAGTSLAPLKTIQKAIDKASSGQVIKIADGTYSSINMYSKSITLVGNISNPEQVKIEGNLNYAVNITSCSPELHGMTLWKGKGIYIWSGYPKFSHLFITQCSPAIYGGGSFSFSMDNSLIWNNNCGLNPVMSFHPSERSTQYFTNVTIAENTGSTMFYLGGTGVYNSTTPSYCDLLIYNSMVYNYDINSEIIREKISSNFIGAWYSDIRNTNRFLGTGNELCGPGLIDVNPYYIMSYNDYRLNITYSKLIDAGDPALLDRMPPGRGSSRSDIGAYGGNSSLSEYFKLPY